MNGPTGCMLFYVEPKRYQNYHNAYKPDIGSSCGEPQVIKAGVK